MDLHPAVAGLVGLLGSAFVLLCSLLFLPFATVESLWPAVVVTGALLGILLAYVLDFGVNDAFLGAVKPIVLPGETLLIVETNPSSAAGVFDIFSRG